MEAVVDGDDSTKAVRGVRGRGRGRHTVIGAVTIVVERVIPTNSEQIARSHYICDAVMTSRHVALSALGVCLFVCRPHLHCELLLISRTYAN